MKVKVVTDRGGRRLNRERTGPTAPLSRPPRRLVPTPSPRYYFTSYFIRTTVDKFMNCFYFS